MTTSIENLKQMRSRLELIQQHLPRFGSIVSRPPILDIDHHHKSGSGSKAPEKYGSSGNSASIPGLRAFQEYVRHDIDQIDLFLKRHASRGLQPTSSSFSTNAPYLIAVWNELVRAPQPIVAVDKTFKTSAPTKHRYSGVKSAKSRVGTKVDVVAENGRRWIRVNTIKNSRLLAEFREHDSYLTSSEEEEESSECSNGCHCAKPGRDELNNSLIQMGRSLVSAAESQPGTKPRITLALTRLELDSKSLADLQAEGLKVLGDVSECKEELDARIPRTIRELLDMDIEVIVGERDFIIPQTIEDPSVAEERRFVPSQQVNLDLSAIIALVSDMTHAPLPASIDEAYTRFIPTPAEKARSIRRRLRQKAILAQAKTQTKTRSSDAEKKRSKTKADVDGCSEASDVEDSESVHSRALASQVLREMESGLLNEIALRMRHAQPSTPSSLASRYWASKEVRDRCLRIVDKIGGPRERRRAAALFYQSDAKAKTCVDQDGTPQLGYEFLSEEDAIDAYWFESRHSRSMLPGLVPLCIIDEDEITTSEEFDSKADAADPFWSALDNTSRLLLASGPMSHPRDLITPLTSRPAKQSSPDSATPSFGERIEDGDEIARAAVVQANTRLTMHTVQTLAHGADPRRRWTTLTANWGSVREVLRECSREDVSLFHNGSDSASQTVLDRGSRDDRRNDEDQTAAIWILDPRSLAEGMRGDFMAC